MKIYLFIHFEPTDEHIAITGLESKINNFSKNNKKWEYDKFQLYGLVDDFNQNHTSDTSIKITQQFIDLIQKFPSVLFNPDTLSKIKKISMKKVFKLDNDEYYKQDKFTKEIVNLIIGWFITLCAENNWNIVKSFN